MGKDIVFKLIGLLALIFLIITGGLPLYRHRYFSIPVVKGPGVTSVFKLSLYSPGLRGSPADTNVFVLEGYEPGGKAIILGNTHANEPEGMLASVVIIEQAVVEKGTVYIIPFLNKSASRNTKPGDGYPLYFDISTDWGKRRFRMGSRDASPLDSWPDPDVYIHYPDRQLLSFIDIRNVNRSWPGRRDGSLMEKVTFGVMELIRKENINVAIDIHGAETMFPVTNCVVAPENAVKIATLATMTVKASEGFDNHVEPSPAGFRGLSHREIGDYSQALPFLLEAPIPFLDQPTGPKTMELLLSGQDPFLLKLSKKKKLFVPYDESGWSLDRRVGQHLSVTLEIIRQYSKRNPAQALLIKNVPRYKDLLEKGLRYYLANPGEVPAERIVIN